MKLKIYFIIQFLLVMLFAACSSTSRYSGSSVNDSGINTTNILETEIGTASFYADEFNGKKTANGEIYDMNELTSAHPKYPFNTIVEVTNLKNNRRVQVRINDRMPNFKNRIIDLSLKAAEKLGMVQDGIQEVKVEVIKWGK